MCLYTDRDSSPYAFCTEKNDDIALVFSELEKLFNGTFSQEYNKRERKQEVSFKKIIVDGYRAVGSLNTKMIAFSLQTFCCCSLLILVNGETCKSYMRYICFIAFAVFWCLFEGKTFLPDLKC